MINRKKVKKYELHYRLLEEVPDNALIGVRSAGHTWMNYGYVEIQDPRYFTQLFWVKEGRCEMILDGEVFSLKSGDLFIYPPNHKHSINATHKLCCLDWFTLDGKLSTTILKSLGIEEGLYRNRHFPESKFHDMITCLSSTDVDSYINTEQLAYAIFQALANNNEISETKNSIADQAVAAMHDNLGNCKFSILELADELGIHRSTFSRKFAKSRGCSPQDFLLSLRMKRSEKMLLDTNLNVAEIARLCGYEDASYFTRAFKKFTGLSPREMRNKK